MRMRCSLNFIWKKKKKKKNLQAYKYQFDPQGNAQPRNPKLKHLLLVIVNQLQQKCEEVLGSNIRTFPRKKNHGTHYSHVSSIQMLPRPCSPKPSKHHQTMFNHGSLFVAWMVPYFQRMTCSTTQLWMVNSELLLIAAWCWCILQHRQ